MNALRLVSRAPLRLAPSALPTTVRTMATLDDRERAMEKAYFNKKDELLMRQLLAKMKSQTDVEDVHVAEGVKTSELSSLNAIVGKYKMSDADIDALIEWRHDHSF